MFGETPEIDININAIDNTSNAISGIRGAVLTLNQAMQAASQVATTVKQAYDATVGTFITYAASVKSMSLLTNDSVGDMSRLITVTNDYGVSTSDLTMAQKALAKTGQSLSVDTLGQLSDQFIALGTGVEKTDFLIKNFGRSGADLVTVMNLGSAAIHAESDAINGNLVLTAKQIQQAQDLAVKQKQVNDILEATKIEIGEKLTPTLINLLNYNNQYETVLDHEHDTVLGNIASYLKFIPVLGSVYDAYELIAAAVAGIFGQQAKPLPTTTTPASGTDAYGQPVIPLTSGVPTPKKTATPKVVTPKTLTPAQILKAQKAALSGGISRQADGGDYMVNSPTVFMAGEAGPERATFTPMNRGNTTNNWNITAPSPLQAAAAVDRTLLELNYLGIPK